MKASRHNGGMVAGCGEPLSLEIVERIKQGDRLAWDDL
jgi:hypothetical protein